ncbi:lipocalin/fatty acid-binding family protein [Levilactobacillus brevis]|uniref:hypothetical protein n=1 Tax=Levilactobacillus brevis TaxID=1580 RepID=UPI001780E777|nr:hypothetical protein [Levilactobacillus brevis]
MADSSRTIMTDAGFALETRVRADETKMQFTRATISTDNHFSDTDDALAKLTELSNIQQDGKVTAVQVINTTTVYVQVDVNQAESKADYQMRSAALYAKDDDGTEVLYGVTVLQDPVFVHKDADGSYLGFGINTTVGRASNVVVVVDPANMVTQQVFESTMKNYYTKAEVDAKFVTDDDFASKLPKNIATTDAANTFAKSQTLAGGATDGKGNAYATTKDVATGLKNGFNTKVNVSDMRKPASDVAGIEEVNAKQDKIGYTPADDSKVVHTTDTSNWQKVKTSDDNGNIYSQLMKDSSSSWESSNGYWNTPVKTISLTAGVTYFISAEFKCTGSNKSGIELQLTGVSGTNTSSFKIMYGSEFIRGTDKGNIAAGIQGFLYIGPFTPTITGDYHLCGGMESASNTGYCRKMTVTASSSYVPWEIAMANSISPVDNQDGTISINGNSYTPADDSKVAHLSGANNFDTVPTVNNNPLLLASSLPSDLARLSQDANFTAKLQQNGQDVALANNTIARNPNTGVVSESVDFTNLTVNGGKSVATSDDLKSIEDLAWREVTSSYFQGSYLFRDNQDGTVSLAGTIYFANPTQKYNMFNDYVIILPDGYKATGIVGSDSINTPTKEFLRGYIFNDDVYSIGLSSYFPGTAFHVYQDGSEQSNAMVLPLHTVRWDNNSGLSGGNITLKVTKTS